MARVRGGGSDAQSVEESLEAVRRVYAELALRPATRDCRLRTGCCRFRLTGLVPQLTRGEALLAARALRATGRKELARGQSEDGACPLLAPESGHCRIYSARPFGCRTHFCQPAGGPFARNTVLDLIRRLEAVDRSLGGDGPHNLQAAVEHALAALARQRRPAP